MAKHRSGLFTVSATKNHKNHENGGFEKSIQIKEVTDTFLGGNSYFCLRGCIYSVAFRHREISDLSKFQFGKILKLFSFMQMH
jgi:hypothetical protein